METEMISSERIEYREFATGEMRTITPVGPSWFAPDAWEAKLHDMRRTSVDPNDVVPKQLEIALHRSDYSVRGGDSPQESPDEAEQAAEVFVETLRAHGCNVLAWRHKAPLAAQDGDGVVPRVVVYAAPKEFQRFSYTDFPVGVWGLTVGRANLAPTPPGSEFFKGLARSVTQFIKTGRVA